MKHYLSLENTNDTLFVAIANTIKEYYPIGISTLSPEYNQLPVTIKHNEIIAANIDPPKRMTTPHREQWQSLLERLKKETKKQIEGTTYGFVPGFSADLILERYEDESLVRIKRIAFAVSILGPFFSICGVDETRIKEKDDTVGRVYQAVNVVTASPYKEFEEDFNLIERLIRENHPDYKFIPFFVCMMSVKDVETHDSGPGEDCTVYNALFNHLFNYFPDPRVRGDRHYGHERDTSIKVTLTPPPPLKSER